MSLPFRLAISILQSTFSILQLYHYRLQIPKISCGILVIVHSTDMKIGENEEVPVEAFPFIPIIKALRL